MIYYTTHEGGEWKGIKVNIKRSKIVKTLNNHHFGVKKGKMYSPAFSILKGIAHSPIVHSVKIGEYIWNASFRRRR